MRKKPRASPSTILHAALRRLQNATRYEPKIFPWRIAAATRTPLGDDRIGDFLAGRPILSLLSPTQRSRSGMAYRYGAGFQQAQYTQANELREIVTFETKTSSPTGNTPESGAITIDL